MKKTYINPAIEVLNMASEPLLAASEPTTGADTKYNYQGWESDEEQEEIKNFGDFDGDVL